MKSLLLVLLPMMALSAGSSFAGANSSKTVEAQAGVYDNADGSPLLPMIEQSRSSIDIEIYQMGDLNVRNALRRALQRGVRVRIVKEAVPAGKSCHVFEGVGSALFDAFGTVEMDSADADCADQRALVRQVRAAGGSYVPFNRSEFCAGVQGSCLQHGKIVIVDRQQALVSTGNFDASNLCDRSQSPEKCNRDYSVVVDDPEVVGTLAAIFERDLAGRRYDVGAYLQGSVADKVTVSPLSLSPLVNFIRSARTHIQLENQYLKQPEINQELVQAALRGVRVDLTITSLCAFGKPRPNEAKAWRTIYERFDRAGIRSRLFTSQVRVGGMPGYMHAKAIIVDDERAWVGSVNGSTPSVSNNREFGVFFSQPQWVQKLSGVMTADHRDAGTESWTESLECVKDREDSSGSGDDSPNRSRL